jgi:hypothetical protein
VSASSRDILRRSFVGIALEVQGTEYSEVAHETGELKIRFSPPLFYRIILPFFFPPKVLDKAQRGR